MRYDDADNRSSHKPSGQAANVPPMGWQRDPLLTAKEAAAFRRQGLSTFWRQVKQGLVPKPIYITARSPRWYLSDLCPTRTRQGNQAQ